jgi:hypothetical protein
MKYFLIDADDRIAQPQFLNWCEEIDPKLHKAWTIPRLNSFVVSMYEDTDFMDILSRPYFMLSKPFYSLVLTYDKTIQIKYAIVSDREKRKNKVFGMPRLDVVDCLAEGSELNRGGNVLERAVFRREAIKGRTLFQVGGVKSRYIAASLELVESAFRREVMGMRVREVEIV